MTHSKLTLTLSVLLITSVSGIALGADRNPFMPVQPEAKPSHRTYTGIPVTESLPKKPLTLPPPLVAAPMVSSAPAPAKEAQADLKVLEPTPVAKEPTPEACSISLNSAENIRLIPQGGRFWVKLTVNHPDRCPKAVLIDDTWLHIDATSESGVKVIVDPNESESDRVGKITLANSGGSISVTVEQDSDPAFFKR